MIRFIIRRLLITIVLAFVVVTVVFLLLRLIPGDPAVAALGENASQDQLVVAHQRIGLNDNVQVQYGKWWGKIATIDLGQSLIDGSPVGDELVRRLRGSFELI